MIWKKIVNLTDVQLKNPSEKLMMLIVDTYRDVIDAKQYDASEDVVYKKCYDLDNDDYWINSD